MCACEKVSMCVYRFFMCMYGHSGWDIIYGQAILVSCPIVRFHQYYIFIIDGQAVLFS
jgi:hypothetical protein